MWLIQLFSAFRCSFSCFPQLSATNSDLSSKLETFHPIFFRCCEQLLVGRRKQPVSDQTEDLECFCHLMKTCGRILDVPIAKVGLASWKITLSFSLTSSWYQLGVWVCSIRQDLLPVSLPCSLPRTQFTTLRYYSHYASPCKKCGYLKERRWKKLYSFTSNKGQHKG